MNASTLTARAGTIAVAAIAGFASFRHIVDVATHYGEDLSVAIALPFCIDSLMLVSVAAMAEDKRAGRTPRTSARVAFTFGVAASLAANIASAEPTTGARIVAAIPAISLLLAVEVLTRGGRFRRPASATPVATVADTRPDNTTVTAAAKLTDTAPDIQPAKVPATPRPRRQPTSRPAAATGTAAKVAKTVAKLPDATAATVAAKLGISERSARRYLATYRTDSGAATEPAIERVNGSAVAT